MELETARVYLLIVTCIELFAVEKSAGVVDLHFVYRIRGKSNSKGDKYIKPTSLPRKSLPITWL